MNSSFHNKPNLADVSTGKVVIFSGYMVDHPSRENPRFPASRVNEATRSLLQAMTEWGLGRGDIGISGGACGGDLLFAESALALGMQMEIFLHTDEERFVRDSVRFAGQKWMELFQQVVQHPRSHIHILPSARDRKDGINNLFAANNHWMLETALRLGKKRLQGLILGDGKKGDAPGGTVEMQGKLEEEGVQVKMIYL